MSISTAIIMAIIFIKYKPIYEISISGEKVGYVKDKKAFEEKIIENLTVEKQKNIDSIDIKANPEYELKFVERKTETNEEEIASTVEENTSITYKYYEVNYNNNLIDTVDTQQEAEEVIKKIKEENPNKELQLSIVIKYTEKPDEINTTNVEVAKENAQSKILQTIEQEQKAKQEQERINSLPSINGIKIAYTPTNGVISSRYGSIESVRNNRTHSGLDIAAPAGTAIKAIASGKVVTAELQGGYGNLVRLNHGNGVETYYGHCSKLLVYKGQYVNAGETIALVGSTGNSTGPHLHLEIRLNGVTLNPQNYLYK